MLDSAKNGLIAPNTTRGGGLLFAADLVECDGDLNIAGVRPSNRSHVIAAVDRAQRQIDFGYSAHPWRGDLK
jgi:hypothetical protein